MSKKCAVLGLLLFCLAGCKKDIPVTSISLSESAVTLSVACAPEVQVTAAVEPLDATLQEVVFTSSDPLVAQVDENGNTIPVTVTAAHRLNVALNIADYLEANGIIGQAASIDVNDLGDIQFWYGQQYQVKLGNESQLSHKVSLAKGAIDKLSQESHNSGVLDASLTVDKTGVRYTRFQ